MEIVQKAQHYLASPVFESSRDHRQVFLCDMHTFRTDQLDVNPDGSIPNRRHIHLLQHPDESDSKLEPQGTLESWDDWNERRIVCEKTVFYNVLEAIKWTCEALNIPFQIDTSTASGKLN
jgi:hypothetical protein